MLCEIGRMILFPKPHVALSEKSPHELPLTPGFAVPGYSNITRAICSASCKTKVMLASHHPSVFSLFILASSLNVVIFFLAFFSNLPF